jgi:malonate-semialdehyde dehydrogenase (acetylating)/methylmalonate-semialdehyde dehydrogenase
MQVDTLEEAIQIVNNNRYGNGTALFTRSGAVARQFTNEIDIGQVRGFSALLRMCLRFRA